MSSLWRLGRILLAYALSSLVTGYVVWAALFWDGSSDTGMRDTGFGLFIAFLVAWFAATPAAVTVLLGEAKGWRSLGYYAVAGSLIGLLLGRLFSPPWFFPWLGVSFGLVSGGIFWAIAGRHAGAGDPSERRHTQIAMALITALATAFTLPLLAGFR